MYSCSKGLLKDTSSCFLYQLLHLNVAEWLLHSQPALLSSRQEKKVFPSSLPSTLLLVLLSSLPQKKKEKEKNKKNNSCPRNRTKNFSLCFTVYSWVTMFPPDAQESKKVCTFRLIVKPKKKKKIGFLLAKKNERKAFKQRALELCAISVCHYCC